MSDGSFLRAATHPVPLCLLAAGGIAGAAVAWPLAGVGALAYVVGVALSSGAARPGASESLLCEPDAPACAVRSTEVMAHVVRIRKGHAAFHRALRDGPAPVRSLLTGSYDRLCGFVRSAYDLAHKADHLRAHLDLPGGAPDRAKLEHHYAELTKQLVAIATALEGWQAKVMEMAAETPGEAEQGARAVAEELERMRHLVQALEEATRS